MSAVILQNPIPMTPFRLSSQIKAAANQLGFDVCGIASIVQLETHKKYLDNWLGQNYHGRMGYMANHRQKRIDPGLLVPGARSVVVVAMNYYPGTRQPDNTHYKIARYAYGRDYHLLIRQKLESLAATITETNGPHHYRVFTDSAPVMERAWAIEAGLGQTGKNTCLIIPKKGSYYFLGELITSVELQPDQPFKKDLCGTCTRCMEACPTGAIVLPGVLDARRCISYLTIELKDSIPEEFLKNLNGWIFGCDICQEACPHNKHAKPHENDYLRPLEAISTWGNSQWETLQREVYAHALKKEGSPLARASYNKLTENISMVRNNLNGEDANSQ